MLWGGGAPFKQNGTAPNNTLTDSVGTNVHLMSQVAESWAECHRRAQAGEPLLVGVASRSDEPSWAREARIHHSSERAHVAHLPQAAARKKATRAAS